MQSTNMGRAFHSKSGMKSSLFLLDVLCYPWRLSCFARCSKHQTKKEKKKRKGKTRKTVFGTEFTPKTTYLPALSYMLWVQIVSQVVFSNGL